MKVLDLVLCETFISAVIGIGQVGIDGPDMYLRLGIEYLAQAFNFVQFKAKTFHARIDLNVDRMIVAPLVNQGAYKKIQLSK
jgi:hypothetical protein